jgi:hypothetical protein
MFKNTEFRSSDSVWDQSSMYGHERTVSGSSRFIPRIDKFEVRVEAVAKGKFLSKVV